jgi:hypothetical protein
LVYSRLAGCNLHAENELVYPVPAVLGCSIDAKTSFVDQYVALTYFLTPKVYSTIRVFLSQ